MYQTKQYKKTVADGKVNPVMEPKVRKTVSKVETEQNKRMSRILDNFERFRLMNCVTYLLN